MATATAQHTPTVAPAFEQRAAETPDGGSGLFYPATAAGTALILGCLGICLGLLSVVNAEWLPATTTGIVIPAAFTVGGIGIFVGGLWNFRANSLFAGTLGVMYGTLWLSLGLMLLVIGPQVTETAGASSFGDAFGTYLVIWAIVSAGLGVAAFWVGRLVSIAQMLLAVVLLVLGIGAMSGETGITQLGGYLGLIDAAAVLYVSMALIINDTAGKDVAPVF